MERKQLLKDLIGLRRPAKDVQSELQLYPWDSDEELVTIGPYEIRKAVEAFTEGDITAQDLEDWANAIEGRDDIAFTSRKVIDVIAELANPVLYRPLTIKAMQDLNAQLTQEL